MLKTIPKKKPTLFQRIKNIFFPPEDISKLQAKFETELKDLIDPNALDNHLSDEARAKIISQLKTLQRKYSNKLKLYNNINRRLDQLKIPAATGNDALLHLAKTFEDIQTLNPKDIPDYSTVGLSTTEDSFDHYRKSHPDTCGSKSCEEFTKYLTKLSEGPNVTEQTVLKAAVIATLESEAIRSPYLAADIKKHIKYLQNLEGDDIPIENAMSHMEVVQKNIKNLPKPVSSGYSLGQRILKFFGYQPQLTPTTPFSTTKFAQEKGVDAKPQAPAPVSPLNNNPPQPATQPINQPPAAAGLGKGASNAISPSPKVEIEAANAANNATPAADVPARANDNFSKICQHLSESTIFTAATTDPVPDNCMATDRKSFVYKKDDAAKTIDFAGIHIDSSKATPTISISSDALSCLTTAFSNHDDSVNGLKHKAGSGTLDATADTDTARREVLSATIKNIPNPQVTIRFNCNSQPDLEKLANMIKGFKELGVNPQDIKLTPPIEMAQFTNNALATQVNAFSGVDAEKKKTAFTEMTKSAPSPTKSPSKP